ncbi:MAG TPA: site-specific DNA-methyltransferase [Syntrophorhabdaceae bacterium]|nr:site-specific DNA-methyltransferase [Syntrophorhabdaceae bacterium]HQM81170.1 site-specific DNA-methyltransferase [Syntrophorhabdaceae bacterium]HQM82444.1 site-specific DNA-methyltransferase [Syntrophorhabdaceae bacterium]
MAEHHLRQYTRRNTSDFFIHKDLAGFLSRELDFYLKNEVLNLEEMEAAGVGLSGGWFQLMRLIKKVGGRIIEFLAQVEGFQKMLWEKRKFITGTFYCITVGNIKEEFYPEIAACEAQWEEWKALFAIDEGKGGKGKQDRRIRFLNENPALALDTRRFPQDFTDRLLASYEDLDEMTDGLLVHSENWQALNLLGEKYREQVKCIHIDPPYNTQTSGFLYKNDYQHSSWLAMMQGRIALALKIMFKDGAFLCHIDENEHEHLHLLFAHMYTPDGGTIVWDKKNPMLGRQGIATQHEYVLWKSLTDESVYLRTTNIQMILEKAQAFIKKHGGVNDVVRREFTDWIRKVDELTGGERAYCLIDNDGRVYQSVAMGAPEPRTDKKFFIPLIHPITKKPCPVPLYGWSRAPETLQDLIRKDEIIFGADESVQPRRKVFLNKHSKRQLSSVIYDSSRGKNDVDKLNLEFPYCHPVSLYQTLLGAAASDNRDIVLDFFAGSGTTGHAVINLNREDGGRRKFILVEMADYFDTVLLPRIKKVTFSPEWRDGKPKRVATAEEATRGPRIVKVIRLESYEDALNNIAFDKAAGQEALRFKDYLLQYMLKWEVRKSETLLNVEQLGKPFSYRLHIHRDSETVIRLADLPETFNYLIGLDVQTRTVHDDNDRRYLVYRGTTREGRRTVVIWRETEGWAEEDYKRDKEFTAAQKLTEGVDEIYVNGDSLIPGARALEAVFKARMFAPVEG